MGIKLKLSSGRHISPVWFLHMPLHISLRTSHSLSAEFKPNPTFVAIAAWALKLQVAILDQLKSFYIFTRCFLFCWTFFHLKWTVTSFSSQHLVHAWQSLNPGWGRELGRLPVRSHPGRVEVSLSETPNPQLLLTSWLAPCMAANHHCVLMGEWEA